jgi:hypothetical protein
VFMIRRLPPTEEVGDFVTFSCAFTGRHTGYITGRCTQDTAGTGTGSVLG